MTTHLLIDLDDTLYAYAPCAAAAERTLMALVERDLGVAASEVAVLFASARRAVKERLGPTGAAHSRLLYLSELVHAAGRTDALPHVRRWERAYWTSFLSTSALRPGARELLRAIRAHGGKVAIVSDLVLEVQLWKLEHFGIFQWIDALVTSEEVPQDKPRPEAFQLAMRRIGAVASDCVMVGDHPDKDGAGAGALGIRYFQVDVGDGHGSSLEDITSRIGASS